MGEITSRQNVLTVKQVFLESTLSSVPGNSTAMCVLIYRIDGVNSGKCHACNHCVACHEVLFKHEFLNLACFNMIVLSHEYDLSC